MSGKFASLCTLTSVSDKQLAYPEPFELLIPGRIEGEALDGGLVGLVMQLELDVGVRVAVGVCRGQVLPLVQGHQHSALHTHMHSYSSPLHTPSLSQQAA